MRRIQVAGFIYKGKGSSAIRCISIRASFPLVPRGISGFVSRRWRAITTGQSLSEDLETWVPVVGSPLLAGTGQEAEILIGPADQFPEGWPPPGRLFIRAETVSPIAGGASEAFPDIIGDCQSLVSIPLLVDGFDPDRLRIRVTLDLDRDGIDDFRVISDAGKLSGDTAQIGLDGIYPNFSIGNRDYPLGGHSFTVEVWDYALVYSARQFPFDVVDRKVPTPILINGLRVDLMPTGIPGEGRMTVWANDFVASAVTDCSGQVRYSIHRDDDDPKVEVDSITFSCADLGMVSVRIYAWDAALNHDYGETFVFVSDPFGICADGSAWAWLTRCLKVGGSRIVIQRPAETSRRRTIWISIHPHANLSMLPSVPRSATPANWRIFQYRSRCQSWLASARSRSSLWNRCRRA